MCLVKIKGSTYTASSFTYTESDNDGEVCLVMSVEPHYHSVTLKTHRSNEREVKFLRRAFTHIEEYIFTDPDFLDFDVILKQAKTENFSESGITFDLGRGSRTPKEGVFLLHEDERSRDNPVFSRTYIFLSAESFKVNFHYYGTTEGIRARFYIDGHTYKCPTVHIDFKNVPHTFILATAVEQFSPVYADYLEKMLIEASQKGFIDLRSVVTQKCPPMISDVDRYYTKIGLK